MVRRDWRVGNRGGGAVVACGEVGKARAQIGETGDAAHASFAIFCWPARPSSRAMAWKKVPVTYPRRPPLGPSAYSFRIEQLGKRLIAARLDERGIVEFVTAEPRAGAPERAVLEQSRGAIAEMQAALGEARRMGEQARHGVTRAAGVDQPLPQHHVAAAFAMHRTARGELGEPSLEAPGIGERAGMQLRIAAG